MTAYHKNALPAGYQLAEYTLESVLGYGGFGITYLAHDTALGAQVAVKEYLPQEISTRDAKTGAVMPSSTQNAIRDYSWGLKNFVAEARSLARFKHANIVRVLRFLEANGTAYMVMEYEKGTSLAGHLKRHGPKLDEQALLRVFIPILNGLRAVHDAGMLHLDIKPENIYLRGDGSPMLIDFGSARQAIAAAGHQIVALTYGYAPIEQYPDKGKPGPWTDVYSIGAAMYRCITGKRPDDALERYRAVLKYQTDPLIPAAKAGAKRYQQNLLECVDWAMQLHPQERPQSARELQDALMGKIRRAQQKQAPVMQPFARPATARPEPFRTAAPPRRRKARSWAAPALILATLIAAAAVFRPEVLKWWPVTDMPQTTPRPQEQQPAESPREQQAAPARRPGVRRGGERSEQTPPSVLARTLNGHSDWVQALAFFPGEKRLASGGNDKVVRLWDTSSGAALGTPRRHGYAVNAVAVSPDGRWLASAGIDGAVRLWDALGKGRQTMQGYGYSIFSVAFAPDGRTLAAGGKDRTVFLWDVETGRRRHALEGHKSEVYAVVFSPDGRYLASAGADRVIRLWNVATGQEAAALTGHKDEIMALAFAPDGRYLASGGVGQMIRIWDVREGALARTLPDAGAPALSLAYSPDGRWLAAGTAGKTILIFDAVEGRLAQVLSGHRDQVQAVAFSPSGDLLASASRDGSVKLWK